MAITSMEELNKIELTVGKVTNGVDSPNLMSADSTDVLFTEVDKVVEKEEETKPVEEKKEEEEKKENPGLSEEKKEEEKKEETKEPGKKEEIKEPVSRNIEERIGKLTKKWRTAEREIGYKDQKIAELEKELTTLKAQIPLEGKPNKEDFEDIEDYTEALVAWTVANSVRGVVETDTKATEEIHERESVEEVYSEIDDLIENGNKIYSDFEKVVRDNDLKLSMDMLEASLDCDDPVQVLYYLGKNPDEAERIFGLRPAKMVREINAIEAQLKKEKSDAEEAERKAAEDAQKLATEEEEKNRRKITNTPDPINPPRQDGAVDKDPSTMSMSEYRKWRLGGGGK